MDVSPFTVVKNEMMWGPMDAISEPFPIPWPWFVGLLEHFP